MNSTGPTIFIISADPVTAQGCIEELAAFGGRYRTPVVGTVEQARKRIGQSAPAVVFLDKSAIDTVNGAETFESAVALLTETCARGGRGGGGEASGLAFLIASGAVDFVARTGHFLPIVAGMLDRRVRIGRAGDGYDPISKR